jgi:hypothetical protein
MVSLGATTAGVFNTVAGFATGALVLIHFLFYTKFPI